MIGVEPRRPHVALARHVDLHHAVAAGVEMAAQSRQKALGIDADDEPDLAGRRRPAGYRVYRVVGIAGAKRQYLERVPGIHLFRGGEARLAPPRIDLRLARLGPRRA